jgi:hypothetical protein
MKNAITFLLLLLTLLVMANTALAAVYYVSPNGSDSAGDGSQSNPWKTLKYTCNQIAPNQGHTIQLASGTFAETGSSSVPTGVNIQGEGPDKTIITSSYNGYLISLSSSSVTNGNQTLSDFKIQGNNRQLDHGVIIYRRHNVNVHNVHFEEIDNGALEIVAEYGTPIDSPPAAYLSGIEVYNCRFTNCAKVFSSWSSGSLLVGHLQGGLIHDNIINEDRGYGIKFWENGWFNGTKVYNNKITVPPHDPTWDTSICIELWNLQDDCEVYNNDVNTWLSFAYGNKGNGDTSVKVHDNRVVFADYPNDSCGIECHSVGDMEIYNNYIARASFGIAVWGNRSFSNVLIHHNFFHNIKTPYGWGSGIEIHVEGIDIGNIQIFNNIFHSTHTSDSIIIGAKLFGNRNVIGLQIKNNVFFNTVNNISEEIVNNGLGAKLSGCVVTHNMYNNVALTGSGCSFSNNYNENPGLVVSGEKPDPYYKPVDETSPVVDAGIDVGFPFSGAAPDIGAYEFQVQAQVPPAPPTGLTVVDDG